MSRYDYPDPGQDPAYCDGLQAEDDERIDCPVCPQPAWLEKVDAEGAGYYLCSNGHQTVTSPTRKQEPPF